MDPAGLDGAHYIFYDTYGILLPTTPLPQEPLLDNLWTTGKGVGPGTRYYYYQFMDSLYLCKVQPMGTSLGVVIPVDILRALCIERGDRMAFAIYEDNVICIRKLTADEILQIKPPIIKHG